MNNQFFSSQQATPYRSPALSGLKALEETAHSLPQLIAQGEVRAAAETVLRSHSDGLDLLLETGSEALQKTALLDLVMLRQVISVLELSPIRELDVRISDFATNQGMVPTLSYELLILVNRGSAVRTFTGGEIGEVERAFYVGHQVLEDQFESLTRTLLRGRDQLESGCTSSGLLMIDHARDILSKATESFQRDFGLMDPAAFNQFRIYLHGVNGYEGPSGLHSATVHASRFVIFGAALGFRADFIERNRKYYPTCHEELLTEGLNAVDQGRSLVDIARSTTDVDVRKAVGDFAGQMLHHTSKHFATVKRMLVDLSEPGTGGQPMGVFLRQAVEAMKKVRDDLSK